MSNLYINKKQSIFAFFTLLMVLGLNVFGSDEITPVRDRTTQVSEAIVNAAGVESANDVTNEQIAEITSLNLRAKGITGLLSGDFSGMTKLENLNLYGNQLSSLPNGLFDGLTALKTLRLGGNTVDPMNITVSLEKVGSNQVKVVVPIGAPFDMDVTISVNNGSVSNGENTLTVDKGSVESDPVTITQTEDTTEVVTADIGSLPSLPSLNHYGYSVIKSDSLPITIFGNSAPVFSDGESTTRSVQENTAAAQNIGNAVSAIDSDGDSISYSLSGTDAASFDIVSTSGQLQTKAGLDYETKSSYSVTITATDTNSMTDTISVTINVSDVNEAPVFSSDSTSVSVAENTVAGTNIGAAITATDDDNDTLSYRLTGTDAASFDIVGTSGQLQTKNALDYETKNVYYVSIIASDGTLTGSIAVTINITNVDEPNVNNAPVFTDGDSTTRSVQENTEAGVNIGSPISASDADNDTVTYSLSGTDAASFEIVSTSGQLQTKAALNYEMDSSYAVIVTAKDSEDHSVTINVTINVTDVNEAPVFSSDSLTLNIAENSAAGVNIGSAVTATDDDGDTLTYTLSGTDAASFDIANTTGQIRTDASLDYEVKATYSVTVTAKDGDDATDTIGVTINVTNVIETSENVAPVFNDGESTTRSIAENTQSGGNIGNAISATDRNGDTLTYSLGGTDATSFSIESTTGQLKTDANLDHETNPSYSVTITVMDPSGLSDSISVTINVTDVDEAPVFASESMTRSVAENTDEDVNIGSAVTATDDDGDTLTYTLSGVDADSFDFESTTGQIKTKADLDYEDKRLYYLVVTVSDGTFTDSVNVTVRVTNVHESDVNNYPEFIEGIATTRFVNENSDSGTAVGPALNAADSDGDRITFSLGGTDGDSFNIESETGQILTNGKLDYETKDTYAVTVTVSDGNGGSVSIDVTISVVDVLESTPLSDRTGSVVLAIQNAIIDMQLNIAIGINDSVLAAITSLTVPSSDISTFKSGDFSGLTSLSTLKIEDNLSLTRLPSDILDDLSSLKALSVSGNSLLESLPSGIFDSLVSLESLKLSANGLKRLPNNIFDELLLLETLDLSSNSLNNLSENIFQELQNLETLYLNNNSIQSLHSNLFSGLSQLSTLLINNNSFSRLPVGVFDGLTSLDSVSLGQGGTQLSLAVSLSVDQDDKIKARVDTGATFDIEVSVSVTNGSIDQDSSTLTIQTGKRESDNSLSVTRTSGTTHAVTVEIGTFPSIPENHFGYSLIRATSDETEVYPATEESQNSAPVFSEGVSATRSISENTAAGVNIGSAVSATDTDDDTLTYSLGGTDAASFDIDTTNGQLKTKAALDYETDSSYSVTVSVRDDDGASDTISITIYITDVEEDTNSAPVFTEGESATRNITENTAAGVNIGSAVSATDTDDDTLTYSLGGTDAASFDIDTTNGQLKTKAALDYETKTSYSVTITVKDGDNASDSISVTINITDVEEVTNSAPVIIEGASATRSIAENTAAGENIGNTVSATDDDDDTLTYSLNGTDGDSFDIDTTKGQLKTKSSLNFETKRSYSVVVTVSDGSQTDSINITINVTDVNDQPVFSSESATRSIDENTAADTNIGEAISATDEDGDTLTYSLSGTDADDFNLDDSSGQLSTKKVLDYELKSSYSVTITATDTDNATDSINVTINVNDVVDVNLPIFNVTGSITLSIAENTATNINIGDPITATRLEPITYSLGGNDANEFTIGSNSGQIKTKAALDYETKNSYSVRVIATNSDGRSTIDVTIEVTDVLESTRMSLRSSKVRNAIVAALDDVSNADDVTDVDLASIKTLDLSNESIFSLNPNNFDGLSSLEELDLSNNPLSSLHEDLFDGLSSLKKLHLNTCAFQSLHADLFDGLESLNNLNLQYNSLSLLPSDVFDGLSSLTELRLNNNLFTSLPSDAFDDLTSLKKLYINGNVISSLSSSVFQKLSSLTHLYIDNNRLSRLPNNIFKGLTKIKAISAGDNSANSLEMEVTLEADSSNRITAKILTGAPFALTVPVTVNLQGIQSSYNVNISKGATTSSHSIELLVVPGRPNTFTVGIGNLPNIPSGYSGFSLVKSDDLPLNVVAGNIPGLSGAQNSGAMVPAKTALFSNYPNPFNPETWIPYQLSKASNVTMTIYNMRGVVVRELALGHQPAGYYRSRASAAYWDGRNTFGEKVSTGVYFCTFKTGDFTTTRKMLIRK